MSNELSLNDAFLTWVRMYEQQLTAALKVLLEDKHLYQSVTIELGDLVKQIEARVSPLFRDLFVPKVMPKAGANWGVRDNANPPPVSACSYDLTLRVPDVKLFCSRCDRTEVFNSISTEDFSQRGAHRNQFKSESQVVQVFVLSFLCQSCKDVPEVFLVRRKGLKLTLCGRSPMEVAPVPSVVPKAVNLFYGGAMVAHQSGQTLAGIFMLRTLVEQWARSQLEQPPDQADQVMDAYMNTLPGDFTSRFPSIRLLYGELSADMHGAVGSSELFNKASVQILEHFEARRLFKIIERKPA